MQDNGDEAIHHLYLLPAKRARAKLLCESHAAGLQLYGSHHACESLEGGREDEERSVWRQEGGRDVEVVAVWWQQESDGAVESDGHIFDLMEYLLVIVCLCWWLFDVSD